MYKFQISNLIPAKYTMFKKKNNFENLKNVQFKHSKLAFGYNKHTKSFLSIPAGFKGLGILHNCSSLIHSLFLL